LKDEKHTVTIKQKLEALIHILKDGGCALSNNDALTRILVEVQENLHQLDYYCLQLSQLNLKKLRVSADSVIRHKMLLYGNNISNYKMMIEALTTLPKN
jgi:hypothetical protein